MSKYVCFLLCVYSLRVVGQERPLEMKMDFEEYDPPSTLVTEEHKLTRAKFPFIDIHNHQFSMPTQDLSKLVAEMDELNMAVMVNLSGRGMGSSEHLANAVANVNKSFPKRFVVFTNVEFRGIDDPDWGARSAKQLEEDVKKGAKGLKIY
ncbi:MAG: amidohydrolase, partial [Cyclobacteriaceae bacterium]|nr:amidohydrolase [Cyclobacteriaceae bacterium]